MCIQKNKGHKTDPIKKPAFTFVLDNHLHLNFVWGFLKSILKGIAARFSCFLFNIYIYIISLNYTLESLEICQENTSYF